MVAVSILLSNVIDRIRQSFLLYNTDLKFEIKVNISFFLVVLFGIKLW